MFAEKEKPPKKSGFLVGRRLSEDRHQEQRRFSASHRRYIEATD
jgi:hypothetical protein